MNEPSTPQAQRWSERSALLWLIRALMVWVLAYIFVQGQDGFFAVTLERVEPFWVQFVFLNIPLQIALAVIASWGLTDKAGSRAVRFGLVVATIDTLLVLAHIVISAATA